MNVLQDWSRTASRLAFGIFQGHLTTGQIDLRSSQPRFNNSITAVMVLVDVRGLTSVNMRNKYDRPSVSYSEYERPSVNATDRVWVRESDSIVLGDSSRKRWQHQALAPEWQTAGNDGMTSRNSASSLTTTMAPVRLSKDLHDSCMIEWVKMRIQNKWPYVDIASCSIGTVANILMYQSFSTDGSVLTAFRTNPLVILDRYTTTQPGVAVGTPRQKFTTSWRRIAI